MAFWTMQRVKIWARSPQKKASGHKMSIETFSFFLKNVCTKQFWLLSAFSKCTLLAQKTYRC